MNNLNIALDIWKRQYETDFALLDTPQEQIEFLNLGLEQLSRKVMPEFM